MMGYEPRWCTLGAARVLVVDDDQMMLSAVSQILKGKGYDVLSADGPRQALKIVKTPPPVDLVVSDIVMPEELGTQLVREVAEFSPRTMCVLMTAGIIEPGEVPVGVPVLLKPFAKQDLISVVQATLARSAQARADLRCELEKSAELRRQNTHLRAETAETIRQAGDILMRCGPRVKGCK